MNSDDIKAATDTASDKAKSSIRAAKDKAGTVGDAYDSTKEQVIGLSDKLPGSASDAYQAGQRAISQGAEGVSASVAKQPIEALLLAGALGYLVGWATSRS